MVSKIKALMEFYKYLIGVMHMKKLVIALIIVLALITGGCVKTSGKNLTFDMDTNYALLMAESTADGHYGLARLYSDLRNRKKEYRQGRRAV